MSGSLRGLLVACVLGAAAAVPVAVVTPTACADEQHHAGIDVRFSSTSERQFCVGFSGEHVSGIDALRATGLPVVTKVDPTYGEFVCKIGDVGTDLSDCPASDGSYWDYFNNAGGVWTEAQEGASTRQLRCGDADGWSWFGGGTGLPPTPASYATVCPAGTCASSASPSPTPTPLAEASPAPTASPTSAAVTPSPTATVSAVELPRTGGGAGLGLWLVLAPGAVWGIRRTLRTGDRGSAKGWSRRSS